MSGKYTADCEARQKKIKMMAAERETTIAAIAHEWVEEHLEEGEK